MVNDSSFNLYFLTFYIKYLDKTPSLVYPIPKVPVREPYSNHWMGVAINYARLNSVERPLPKFACVLTDNKTTYVGFNSRKTHPLQLKFNSRKNPCKIHLHAEMDAIRQAIRVHGTDLTRFTMYIARVHRSGTPACAAPCEGCLSAIAAFNIQKVSWTNGLD